jgi:deazaflavin-dependent oxidoreductase (nitroreductase family)
MAPDNTSWRFARATAPAVRLLAGRRLLPIWGVVHHRGRVSGRHLTVPVAITTAPGLFVINLPWGARTNWVRNVLAAGGCTIRWRGTDHRAGEPRILDAAEARPYYSRAAWAIAGRLFPADAWLLLTRDRTGGGGLASGQDDQVGEGGHPAVGVPHLGPHETGLGGGRAPFVAG